MHRPFSKQTFELLRQDEAVRAEKEPLNKEQMKRSKAGKKGRAVYLNGLDIKRIRVKQ